MVFDQSSQRSSSSLFPSNGGGSPGGWSIVGVWWRICFTHAIPVLSLQRSVEPFFEQYGERMVSVVTLGLSFLPLNLGILSPSLLSLPAMDASRRPWQAVSALRSSDDRVEKAAHRLRGLSRSSRHLQIFQRRSRL